MKTTYTCLNKQIFTDELFSLVPIRWEDRYKIMQWRNEQIFHLRQNKKLTVEEQDKYFKNTIFKIFDQDQPDQILFSMLQGKNCIAYGGLVHINWEDKNAEISFVMKTESQSLFFNKYWNQFLKMIEYLAFYELDFHKIYTYSYNVRPKLYKVLLTREFIKEGELKDHILIDNKYTEAMFHSKFNILHQLRLEDAQIEDSRILFNWRNEISTRKQSFNTSTIEWEEHYNWFNKKLLSNKSIIYILKNEHIKVGQIRLDYSDGFWEIDYSIDQNHRGKGFGMAIVKKCINKPLNKKFKAIVKIGNISSQKVFEKLNFKFQKKNNKLVYTKI
jgi:RimJ/RimL family protein N-acetyltransferase|tara:strand:+ start:1103 stop:2092 length:990 start_codon:yes stop_codon:yes gene_type:complete